MKKKTVLILIVVLSVILSTAAASAFQLSEEKQFDDHITIDGRTYKVSPEFEIPAGIDKDSPVKLNFSDETHELLSIERLIEDESDNNELEYHFGIVNAITRANTDLEYRVYVDGVGYLFTRQTRIDERIAFLEKYASVALVTKNGKAVICRVLSSNTAIPEKDIFFGKVEHVRGADDFFTLTIDGENYTAAFTTAESFEPGSGHIITDSASDISQEKAKEWDITVLPLTVRFGENVYQDGVTLSPHAFYEKLVETDEIPKTSQIPPAVYRDAFEKAVSAGDQVLCFCLSSGVSGSFESACMAAREYSGQVFVIDTQQFCISEYIIVERAVRLRAAGVSAEEIAETILREQQDAHVIAVFNTLEYLKLGGRISSAAAAVGNILRVKPVLTIEEGGVKVLGKARGSRNSENMLTQFIGQMGGIDFSRPLCLGYTGFDDAFLRKYIMDSAFLYAGHEECLQITPVGATIGTYAGPGAIALAFFAKK